MATERGAERKAIDLLFFLFFGERDLCHVHRPGARRLAATNQNRNFFKENPSSSSRHHLYSSLRRQRHAHLLPPLLPAPNTPYYLELDLQISLGRRRRRRRRRGDPFKGRGKGPGVGRRPPSDTADDVAGRDTGQRPPHGEQPRPVCAGPGHDGGDHDARRDRSRSIGRGIAAASVSSGGQERRRDGRGCEPDSGPERRGLSFGGELRDDSLQEVDGEGEAEPDGGARVLEVEVEVEKERKKWGEKE